MSAPRRTLLVSIDGACWSYLDPLLTAGRLPRLAAVMREGVHGELESLLPPLTPVAWGGVLTGKRSGGNGIYDWVRPRHDTRTFRPVGGADRVGTPIWERLNAAGVRVGMINVPLTYPPPRLDGFVVGGFMIPDDTADHCFPEGLQERLDRRLAPYLANIPAEITDGRDPAALRAVGRRVQAGQVAAAREACAAHPVEVLIVNLMHFDHLNHFEPDRRRVDEALVLCDEHIGELERDFQPDTVLLFSDHGTRRVGGAFLLGRWLADRGYQVWRGLEADARGYVNHLIAEVTRRRWRWNGFGERLARAALVELLRRGPAPIERGMWWALHRWIPFESDHLWLAPALDGERSLVRVGSLNGGLYVDPFGIRDPAERRAVADRLRSDLAAVRDPDTGAPLFTVHDGRQLYGETPVGPAPAVLVDCTDSGWNLTTALPPSPLVHDRYFARPIAGRCGEHARVGMFAFRGLDVGADAERRRAELIDLPATLLHLYDVPIPADFDSRPMPFVAADRPLRTQPGDGEPAPVAEDAAVDSADLERRLRLLGYIE